MAKKEFGPTLRIPSFRLPLPSRESMLESSPPPRTGKNGTKIGCQVIALSDKIFQAVLLPGGLPGGGWDGKNKMLMDGRLEGEGQASFLPTSGKKHYLHGNPLEFSATRTYPPAGHQPCSATIAGGQMKGKIQGGPRFILKKTVRKSPSLGAKPPKDALVLFDGTSKDAWKGGRIDAATKFLNTDSRDIHSKQTWMSYKIHLEFMLPYKPTGRGQGRGNSGFYQSEGSEIQVLDSFGLDGLKNECGAVYNNAPPKVNMCFPPLTWQTYDVELTRDESGQAHISVHHNGVLIHDNLKGRKGGPRHFTLQGHGNPLQYRNIWIVEKR